MIPQGPSPNYSDNQFFSKKDSMTVTQFNGCKFHAFLQRHGLKIRWSTCSLIEEIRCKLLWNCEF